jgi:hypothetical protein
VYYLASSVVVVGASSDMQCEASALNLKKHQVKKLRINFKV